VPQSLQIEFLEQSVREYTQLIRTFEADRVRLLHLEAETGNKDTAVIREALLKNQRGLELLEEALARVQQQLDRARAEAEHRH
jgi:hypothetical protein